MNDHPESSGASGPGERALDAVDREAASPDEDHERRLEVLDRLHQDLEAELEEAEPEARPER